MSDDIPDFDLGKLAIRVYRVGFAKTKDGARGSMFMNACGGTGKAPDGAEISFGANSANVNVTFRYPGDQGDDEYQQQYVIQLKEIIEALHEVNKARRALHFVDAPPIDETDRSLLKPVKR
jgi:hypothetical protein